MGEPNNYDIVTISILIGLGFLLLILILGTGAYLLLQGTVCAS